MPGRRRLQETTGTAVLLFHRFLIQERVGKHRRSRDVILTTCLFLAGKVTEAPRRLRDVINVLHMLTSTGHDEPPLLDKVPRLLISVCVACFYSENPGSRVLVCAR